MDSGDRGQAQTVSTFLDFIKKLAEISVLLGALLFLIGWSYLYGYYSGFGLSSDDLGLSPYQVLVHCVPVILGTGFLVAATIALAVLVTIGYQRVRVCIPAGYSGPLCDFALRHRAWARLRMARFVRLDYPASLCDC